VTNVPDKNKPVKNVAIKKVATKTASSKSALVKMVPLKYAKTLLSIVRNKGYSLERVLAAAEFDFNPFDVAYADVKEIPTLQYSKLFQQVLWVMQDESFNLRGDGDVPNGTFRMMCYCIINCQTLRQAIQRIDEFYQIIWSDRFPLNSLSLENDGKQAVMTYRLPQGDNEKILEKTAAPGMSIWYRFCCWLIGKRINLEEVEFACDEPESLERYQVLFNCAIKFNHSRYAFKFPTKYLAMPIVQNEDTLKEFLVTAPYQLIVGHEYNSLTSQIKSIIGNDFTQGFPSFETLTQLLNTTAPTLRRRLNKEHTTYQQIKDNCRRDAAIAYLKRPELSINRVAELMGFSDPSAFHRSFKKWTGIPPGEFRESFS